ncbi:MAG: UvrD-helicase domain-containing protein, partial [Deltaproteobacteria bacterium]|nr:UvrD-helicase domain-containing protein [Deltaproteobacteria bacterium]
AWKPKKKDVDKAFNDYYNSGIAPEKEDPAYKIFKVFAARLRENNSLTYGSILTGLHLLLPHIKQYLKYKHVMTDESQDSDSLQWYLVRKIQRICKATLFCVADPDQSIYGWRGADTEYLIRNQAEFTTYELEINYRSEGDIVEAANSLISHNKNRIEKTMVADKDANSPIEIKNNLDSAGIAKMCAFLEKESPGVKRAVLGRNHFLLEKMSQIMEDAKIPHTYVGKESKLTNSEDFRRFHAFLKLIVNPYDNFAFLLIRDILDISIEDHAKIRFEAAKEGKSHFQVWSAGGWQDDYFNQFVEYDFAEKVGSAVSGKFDATKIVKFINESPALTNNDHPVECIRKYLDWLAVYDLQDEIREETKGLQLMTMHASKGLEFPTVIIAGMNQGILPSKRATDIEELEAERRLFFVAITRAEDKLIITTRPETSEFHGKVRVEPVSMFVGELMP